MNVKSAFTVALTVLCLSIAACDRQKKEIDNFKLARFYLDQGNDKLALEMLGAELDTSENPLEVHRLIGTILNGAEYYDDAVVHFEAAIALGCGDACISGLIDARLGLGQTEHAEREFRQNLGDRQSAHARYQAARIDFQRDGDHARAIETLRQIDLAAARDEILRLKLAQGRYDEIIAAYDPATEYSESQLLTIAKAHFIERRYPQTEEILLALNVKRSGRLLTREKVEAVDLLVKTNLALDKIEDAELIYHSFLKNNEGSGYVKLQNAMTQLANRNYGAAVDEVETLAQINPKNVQLAQILALAQFGKQDYLAAIGTLEPVKTEINAQSRILLAEAFNRAGRPQDAIAILTADREDEAAAVTLARAYLLQRQPERAAAIIEAIGHQADNPLLNTRLAELWFDLGQFDRIIASFATDPGQPLKIRYLVANSYLRLGREQAAREFARRQADRFEAMEIEGYVEAVNENFDAAAGIYAELARLKPAKKHNFLLASAYLEGKRYAQAHAALRAGFDQTGNNRPLLVLLNRMLLEADHAETRDWLDSIDAEHADYRQVQLLLANHDLVRGRPQQAAQRLQPLLESGDSEVLYLMAFAQGASDPEAAARLLEMSLDEGFSMRAAARLQRHYLARDDQAGLRRLLDRIERFAGADVRSTDLLAKGYLALRQYDKADELAKTLIDQGFVQNGLELQGDVLSQRRHYAEAAKVYRRVLEAGPTESRMLKYYGARISASPGDLEAVLAAAEARLASNPDLHVLRSFVATRYIELDNASAIRHFKILAIRFPDDAVVLNNLAWASLDSNPVEALKYSEKAYLAHTDNESIVDTYVRALIRNDRIVAAKNLLQEKLRQDPDSQNFNELLRSLN